MRMECTEVNPSVAIGPIRGIHLTDNADEIEGRTDKEGLVLRTEFLKKA
jgi:uncharacterized Zn ribbon protein